MDKLNTFFNLNLSNSVEILVSFIFLLILLIKIKKKTAEKGSVIVLGACFLILFSIGYVDSYKIYQDIHKDQVEVVKGEVEDVFYDGKDRFKLTISVNQEQYYTPFNSQIKLRIGEYYEIKYYKSSKYIKEVKKINNN